MVAKYRIYLFILIVSGTASAGEIEWSGFGSAYYGQTFQRDYLPTGFQDHYPNFTTFSRFGLNLGSRLDDKLSVAAQVVASSAGPNESWTMDMKWGYFIYRPLSGLQIKGGRQLLPILFANEFSQVGYLLPYRAIPAAVLSAIPSLDSMGFQLLTRSPSAIAVR